MTRSHPRTPAALHGTRAHLIPLTEEHLEAVRRWRSDADVTRYWITQAVPTPAEILAWFSWNQASGTLTWAILAQDGSPIGYTNLFDIHEEHRKAELSLMIGERDYWGQGYARDALAALLRHAFTPRDRGGLGLHKIYLAVFVENAAARRVYAACGFREDGILRDDIYRDGRWHDQVLMSVLEHEFAGVDAGGRQAG